jgi:hypothetical protein
MAFVTMQSGSNLVPAKEIIQDTCCECGGGFDVHWDAWSGMYTYPFEWEEYIVFCSANCLASFEKNLCYDCNQPRSCCFHATMEAYDYAEDAEATEETDERYDDNDTSAYRELFSDHK